jgi:hypothetical protein
VEAYTRKVGVHNVLEISRFLWILGPQTIQCTLKFGNDVIISFVCKTSRRTVEYIQVMSGKQDDPTINFEIDLKWMSKMEDKTKAVKIFIAMIAQSGNINRLWNTFRLFIAFGTEVLMWKLTNNSQKLSP